METDINRLLMEFEHLLKEANREYINPQVKELSIDDLAPLADMVARSRGVYLRRLFELSRTYKDSEDLPNEEELQELSQLRQRFLDLVEGSKSFETAIQRGYLDIKPRKGEIT